MLETRNSRQHALRSLRSLQGHMSSVVSVPLRKAAFSVTWQTWLPHGPYVSMSLCRQGDVTGIPQSHFPFSRPEISVGLV